jgi:hypothetical protein
MQHVMTDDAEFANLIRIINVRKNVFNNSRKPKTSDLF